MLENMPPAPDENNVVLKPSDVYLTEASDITQVMDATPQAFPPDSSSEEVLDFYDNPAKKSRFLVAREVIGRTLRAIPGAKTVGKVGDAFNDTVDAFCVDAYVQYTNAETRAEKARIIGSVAGAGVAQAADRLRLPEAFTIPLAIEVAENHDKVAGSLALVLGVYTVQNAVGSTWGLGLRKFRHATETFDSHFPEYKNYAAEGNAGYLKTLYRQSVLGIGVGNSPFMAGEVIHNPDITHQSILEKANRSSRRIALTAGVIGYGALTAAEEWYDKSIGIPNVVDWTVPEVVENMKKASFWIIGGLAIDIVPRIIGKSLKSIKNAIHPPRIDAVAEGTA